MRKQLAIFTLASSIAASAQSVGVSFSTITPEDSVVNLQEIEVNAKKGSDNMKSSTPVHELDANAILITGVTDISDAMRRLPGVNLRDYGGAGGMKTVSVRGLGTQHTGVTYDGTQVSDIQGGQIDLSRFNLENIAGLSLNISDTDNIFEAARLQTSSSRINIMTMLRPDMTSKKPDISFKIKSGSFGLITSSARIALSNSNNLGFAINGDFTHADNNYPYDLRNGNTVTREKRINSKVNSGHIELNGIWLPSNGSTVQAKIYGFDSKRHLPGPVTYYNPECNQTLAEKTAFGQVSGSVRLNDHFRIKGLVKYNFGETRYMDVDDIYPGGVLNQNYHQQEEYGSASLLYSLSSEISFAYSADLWHNSLRSNLKENSDPFRNSFLQGISFKWRWSRLTAVARGLYSIYADRSNSSVKKNVSRLSPSLSLSVQPLDSDNWNLRLSYKDIIRMPTFNELYFDHYGTLNLDPEKAIQYNFGTTWTKTFDCWINNVEISADGYLNYLRNKIVAVPYNMFVWTMTNLGKVNIIGADVALSLDFKPALQHDILFNFNYSYQRCAVTTSREAADWRKQLPYTSLNSGSSSLAWLNPWVNISIHATASSGRYSSTLNIPSTKIGGYIDLGLTAYREFHIKALNLEARIDLSNLLDKSYEIVARYPMPGRNFAFSIALKY